MANLQVKDGASATKYLKNSGAGTDVDPHIPEHLETNSAAIRTAVELLDNAISGTAMQVVSPTRTYTHAATTAAVSGDQTLVAAPGVGNHLVIKDLVVQNESATETTIILKSGATAHWRAKLEANAAFTLSFGEGEEWRLGSNAALVLNLSGANSHGYSIRHRTEAD